MMTENSVQHGLEASAQGTVPGRGRLAGRRILVVGGGQLTFGMEGAPVGNGRAISLLCGREGASVAVADVNGDAAAETAGLVASEGQWTSDQSAVWSRGSLCGRR